MEKIFLLCLITVVTEASLYQRSNHHSFKPETKGNPSERNDVWSNAFKGIKANEFKILEDTSGVSDVSDKKENVLIDKQTEKKHAAFKIDYNALKTLLKMVDRDITSFSHRLEFSMKPSEPIVTHSTTLISNIEIPFLTDKKKIWGVHPPGLDSGILGIGAIDMGHGLRQFGLR